MPLTKPMGVACYTQPLSYHVALAKLKRAHLPKASQR